MRKLIFGVALLFAIVLSLNIDMQKNGTEFCTINLDNLAKTAYAQDECSGGSFGFTELYINGDCYCEFDPFDCCFC